MNINDVHEGIQKFKKRKRIGRGYRFWSWKNFRAWPQRSTISRWTLATPNLSRQVRALPSIECAAGWRGGAGFQKSMPYEIWETLSEHARHISRHIVEAPGVWPFGAGELQPLAARRREGYELAAGGQGEVEAVYTDPSSAGTAVRLFNKKTG